MHVRRKSVLFRAIELFVVRVLGYKMQTSKINTAGHKQISQKKKKDKQMLKNLQWFETNRFLFKSIWKKKYSIKPKNKIIGYMKVIILLHQDKNKKQ